MRQSRVSFLNEKTEVARAITSVLFCTTHWRHGRSRGETKYSSPHRYTKMPTLIGVTLNAMSISWKVVEIVMTDMCLRERWMTIHSDNQYANTCNNLYFVSSRERPWRHWVTVVLGVRQSIALLRSTNVMYQLIKFLKHFKQFDECKKTHFLWLI